MTQFKEVLKMVGPSLESVEQCQDQVSGIKTIPGYLHSYIDVKGLRVVSFHEVDNISESKLQRGQSIVMIEE